MNKIKNMLLTTSLVFLLTLTIGCANVVMIASWLLALIGVWSAWISVAMTVVSAMPLAVIIIWCTEERTNENKKKTR